MKYVPSRKGFFDDVFDDMFQHPFFSQTNTVMKTDIHEMDGNYVLDVELPGYKKEDVNLQLKNGYLTLSASISKDNEEKDDKGTLIRSERYRGNASRSYYVGEDVKPEDIKANFADGILKITVAKKEAEAITTKNIEIE